jgi:hypothetical protein
LRPRSIDLTETLKPGLHWSFDVAAEVEDPDSVGAATHKASLLDNPQFIQVANYPCARALLLSDVELRELFVKNLNLGQVVDYDVHVFGMMLGVILVVVLGGIKFV